MANIAQMVNVLQALVFTRDNDLVLTPTYYVFKMFKVHQDANLLPIQLTSNDYTNGTDKLKSLNASASIDKSGKVHITIVNVDPLKVQTVQCKLNGLTKPTATGEIITADNVTDYNDFAVPEKINLKAFTAFKLNGNEATITIPAKSVICLELK